MLTRRICSNCNSSLTKKANESIQSFNKRITCGRKCAHSLHLKNMAKFKSIIKKLYNDEHYSATEVGKRLIPPLSRSAVLTLLHRFKIPIRTNCGSKHKRFFDNSNKIVVDKEIREIFDGLLLGDGYIDSSGYGLILSQSVKHKDWVKLIAAKFKERNFVTHIKNKFHKSTYITRNPSVRLSIQSCDWFQKEKKRWYPHYSKYRVGKKIVPPDVRITPRSVAHWYMGDGSLCQRMLDFATNCFTKEECEFLVIKLNKLIRNTNFHINKQTGHVKKYGIYYAIQACRINDIKLFTKTVQPYITKSFTYKLQQKKQLKISRNYHRIYDRHYRHGGEVK